MRDFEVGTIIHQTNSTVTYEVMERQDDRCFIKSYPSEKTMWIPDISLQKYLDENKGYIGNPPPRNRLESVE